MSFTVDRIESVLSYQEFYNHYISGNKPCLLSADFTKSWPCRTDWIGPSGFLNHSILSARFGNAKVPVSHCDDQQEYGMPKEHSETFQDYLNYLQEEPSTRASYKYLKDWHFQKTFPEYHAYDVPQYFSSDWLNEYCDSVSSDDYRFLYLGPSGSWTAFHEDVLQSFSWSANICGRKKWFLFAPGKEIKLRSRCKEVITDVRKCDLNDCEYTVVIQEAGEILFVPTGWHHQVHNLMDTLSINHNWINAANVRNTWDLLRRSLESVENEISDCRGTFSDDLEWGIQCQKILKMDLGMNFEDFFSVLEVIGRNRLKSAWMVEKEAYQFDWKRDFEAIKDILGQAVTFQNECVNFAGCEKFDTLLKLLQDVTDIM